MASQMGEDTGNRSGTAWLILVMAGSIALSVGGIVYAIRWGTAADGGRGGAIAVAVTFAMLFLGEPRLGKARALSALEQWQNTDKAADVKQAFDAAVVADIKSAGIKAE